MTVFISLHIHGDEIIPPQICAEAFAVDAVVAPDESNYFIGRLFRRKITGSIVITFRNNIVTSVIDGYLADGLLRRNDRIQDKRIGRIRILIGYAQ